MINAESSFSFSNYINTFKNFIYLLVYLLIYLFIYLGIADLQYNKAPT